METFINILPIIAFFIAWFGVASFYKAKGKGVIIRHLTGFVVGALALIISIILVTPKTEPNTQSSPTETEVAKPLEQESKTSEPDIVQESPKEEFKAETVNTNPESLKTEEPKKEDKSDEPAQTIGINIKQFSQLVNKNFKEIESPFKMPNKPKIKQDDNYDTMNYAFSDDFTVFITLEKKTHNVISIVTGISPKSNPKDNLVMFFSNSALLSAYEGQNQMKVIGKKFILMMTEAAKEFEQTGKSVTKSFIHNGKKYEIGVIKGFGILSSATIDD